MQAVYHWFPGLGTKSPTPMPHEHDEMACSKHRPSLNLPAGPNLLKRARSSTLSSSPPLSTQVLPNKRLKTDAGAQVRTEEQALPAAQEHFAPTPLPPLATSPGEVNASSGNRGSFPHPTATLPSSSNLTSHNKHSSHQGNHPSHSSSPSFKMDPTQRQRAQEKIQSHFDLEILLKHDELRQIEQELAKVNVALEQLRRCRVIPFPGDPGSAVTHQQMVDGTGPALAPPDGMSRPARPATWGVVDGPYSRHYRQWLLPDPEFDSEPTHRQKQPTGDKAATPTATRAGAENTPSHRRGRHSTGGKAQVNTSDQAFPPKERAPHGPQTLRRPDGQLVKLKCKDCGKEDVSSVQGFLNHCRIAHSNDMKSHADAANVCGVPVDGIAEAAQVPTTESTNVVVPSQRNPGLVHPLNQPLAAASTSTYFNQASTAPRPSAELLHQLSPIFPQETQSRPSKPFASSLPTTPLAQSWGNIQNNPSFVPSPEFPSLSALAQTANNSAPMNLAQLVTNAKQKCDLDSIQPLIPDNDVEEESAETNVARTQPHLEAPTRGSATNMSRAPASGVRALTKPPSIEVPSNSRQMQTALNSHSPLGAGMPSSSPNVPPNPNSLSPFTFGSNADAQMMDLSPRTNPPGLVTDHEDDDDMDDEAKSVAENPNASQQHVRIYGDHGDLGMTGISAESECLVPQWSSHCATAGQPTVESAPVPNQSTQKKRRGRPKKGKEKVSK